DNRRDGLRRRLDHWLGLGFRLRFRLGFRFRFGLRLRLRFGLRLGRRLRRYGLGFRFYDRLGFGLWFRFRFYHGFWFRLWFYYWFGLGRLRFDDRLRLWYGFRDGHLLNRLKIGVDIDRGIDDFVGDLDKTHLYRFRQVYFGLDGGRRQYSAKHGQM